MSLKKLTSNDKFLELSVVERYVFAVLIEKGGRIEFKDAVENTKSLYFAKDDAISEGVIRGCFNGFYKRGMLNVRTKDDNVYYQLGIPHIRNKTIRPDKISPEVYNIFSMYKNMLNPMLPDVKVITPEREKAVQRLLNRFGEDVIKEVFTKVSESDFLCGIGGAWKANFDWIIRTRNFIRIYEGTYSNNSDKINRHSSKRLENKVYADF